MEPSTESATSPQTDRHFRFHARTLDQNTRLTQVTQELARRIEELTAEIHHRVVAQCVRRAQAF